MRIWLRILDGCALVLVSMLLAAPNCDGGGKPTIDRLLVLYDIACGKDQQGVDWQVSNTSSTTLSLQDNSGKSVYSKSVPANSGGTYNVPISSYLPGWYKVVLTATNSNGTSTRDFKFLLAGLPGSTGELWNQFNKIVEKPTEGPWMGFTTSIPVMVGQGLTDEENTISVTEHVYFRQFRWRPDPLRWADRGGCTSPGLWLMDIGQYANVQTGLKKDTSYTFRSDWKPIGEYTFTVNWAPCIVGVSGATTTFTDVQFSFELQALCH